MQLHHTSTLRSRTPGRRPLVVAGVALLAVAALGTWQHAATREGTSTTVVERAPVAAAPLTQTDATPTFGKDTAPTIYLVASAEQAAQVEGAILDGNRILAQFGQSGFDAQVVVIGSTDEEAAVVQALYEADAIRAGMGLPPMPVIDLRGR
jgi:hypothetical protein